MIFLQKKLNNNTMKTVIIATIVFILALATLIGFIYLIFTSFIFQIVFCTLIIGIALLGTFNEIKDTIEKKFNK